MSGLAYAAFLASGWLLVYAFAGYPVGVWLLARFRPLRIDKQPVTPTVSVIIVVHDGAMHIRSKLANLATLNYPPDLLEIIVVCDGCRDGTPRLARMSGDPRVRVLGFVSRRGKANCLNSAVASAHGDVLLFTDAHQTIAPIALRELVANLADPQVGIVSGELLLTDDRTGFARGIDTYWRYEKALRLAESRSGSTIGVSSGLYAMRRNLFAALPPDLVLDDVLIPMRVARAGRRVVFEPRALAWDRLAQHPDEDRGRRVRGLAGHCQLAQRASWLLSPKDNPLWLRFISHKLLRLAAPWLLLVLAATSLLLARTHMACLLTFACLLVGAGLVAAGRMQPLLARWLPVRLALTFFYLNVLSAQALLAYARNRESDPW
ncbi:glycosyltransferase family 2 protein [Dyella soli]|uniref:Glycosyltransferase family 2 protein n=1 Tax=Dyella soli TaxID=522319 RepID=A0A4R0YNE5_9GAMM|nr:glycosyltransferase family 2 protein [Dyella soli]TCI10447.1 glycosyltransferase family 2 protein [Dyella soli]